MSNNVNHQAPPIHWIHTALDFSGNTAFVGVQIPPETGNMAGTAAMVTSGGRVIPWNEENFLENGIVPVTNSTLFNNKLYHGPGFLEPRWSLESIRDYQSGGESPATAEIFQNVRSYLQKYLGLRHPVEYDLVSLWIMGTYLKPLFQCYPILFFNAPYESGKSRCLEVVSQLSLNGKCFGEITPAAFRRYAESEITFCLDELKDVGLKNDSPLISILLNAYNGSEVAISDPVKKGGWQPVIFKITSPVAMGNIQDIKNEALKSRTIQIRTEYESRYKNIRLPKASHCEPARIRDGLYCWFLGNWKSVRDRYQTYPDIPDLGAREMDSYLPLLSIASLAGPETAGRLTDYAVAVREEKRLVKKATDDHLNLLLFLKAELDARRTQAPMETFPVISNRELADAYGRKNNLRVNYRRFIEMVTSLHVVSDIIDRQGSKYLVFNPAEVQRQLQMMESKS